MTEYWQQVAEQRRLERNIEAREAAPGLDWHTIVPPYVCCFACPHIGKCRERNVIPFCRGTRGNMGSG